MRRRPARRLQTQPTDPVACALARARRARRKGELRQEVNALRQACSLREYDASMWTRLGAACLRMSRNEEAGAAFKHALWLREREGDEKRARVMRRLIGCASRGEPLRRAA